MAEVIRKAGISEQTKFHKSLLQIENWLPRASGYVLCCVTNRSGNVWGHPH